jgi:hypothetical protein
MKVSPSAKSAVLPWLREDFLLFVNFVTFGVTFETRDRK